MDTVEFTLYTFRTIGGPTNKTKFKIVVATSPQGAWAAVKKDNNLTWGIHTSLAFPDKRAFVVNEWWGP